MTKTSITIKSTEVVTLTHEIKGTRADSARYAAKAAAKFWHRFSFRNKKGFTPIQINIKRFGFTSRFRIILKGYEDRKMTYALERRFFGVWISINPYITNWKVANQLIKKVESKVMLGKFNF